MEKGIHTVKRTNLFITLIVLFITLSGTKAENILTNPGFESGTTGWYAFGGCGFTTSTTVYRSGSRSGYASSRTATWQGISQSLLGKMAAGKTYTITGWMRLEGASSNGDKIAATIKKVDDSGTSYTQICSTTGFNDEWTPLSGSYTLTVSGTLTNLDLYFEGPAAGVNYYLDDVNVVLYEPPTPDPNATGEIDTSTRHQIIEGFGASGAWCENWLLAEPCDIRNGLYNILFSQLGLDIYRVRNTYDQGSSGAAYIANTKQIVEAAKTRNPSLKILISAWSPPAYLKRNNDVNSFPQPGTLKKDANGVYMYAAYADWWADSLAAFDSNGIHADYIGLQNEPDFEATYDSCKFLPTEDSNYAGHDQACEAVYQELYSRMGSNMPKILAPETMGFGGSKAYIHSLIDANHIYGFAHHLYADGSYDFPDSFILGMQGYAAQYSYKPLLQTEYSKLSGNTTDFTAAMNTARHIHNSLVYEGVCSYFYWDLFWAEPDGLVGLSNPWTNPGVYNIHPVYYAFKQYSAFTDPNWQRLETQTDSNGLRISAFISPDNNQMSVIIINPSDVNIALDLSVGNFDVEDSNIYRTSQTENCILVGKFVPSGDVNLPAKSITTIALTGTLIPTNCQEVQDFHHRLLADLTGDCYVNYKDLLVMTDYWLDTSSTVIPSPDIHPGSDNRVNLLDFAALAAQWLTCNDPDGLGCISNW